MKFDALFLDYACTKPYTFESHEEGGLGGTELATIRLAEGFASKGLKVGVINHFDGLPSRSPNNVQYLPVRWMSVARPSNVIHLRSSGHLNIYTKAKQFIWMHDAVAEKYNNVSGWPKYVPNTVQLITVSDWHKENILSQAPTLNVKRIYSPVDELCYTHPRPAVDVNQLVWMASPHKGLDKALELFSELHQNNPALKLCVFNPGYFENGGRQSPGVKYVSKASRGDMRLVVASSLALFNPSTFEETFGMIAAEAEALGVPCICNPLAGLKESAQTHYKVEDIPKLQRDRPVVNGQERFRFENIWPEWEQLLAPGYPPVGEKK